LTILLCTVGIGKRWDDDFVNRVAHKIRLEPLSINLECTGGFTLYIYCTVRMNFDDLKRSRPSGSQLAQE